MPVKNCDKSPTGMHCEVIQSTGNGTAVGTCKYCLNEIKQYGDVLYDKTKISWRDFKIFPRRT